MTLNKKINYDEIINRLGYFRTKANLSMRELSFRLGYTEQFIKRIENKSVELKVKTLLDFCDVVGITIQDFFYLGDQYNKNDKDILELISDLSEDDTQMVIDLIKRLK